MKAPIRTQRSAMRDFLSGEASGGLVLMAAAAAAMLAANSPMASTYFRVLESPVGPLSLLHWINDGLMALFFLLVGLELKREFLDGQLSTWPRRVLPAIAALGGMAAPALVYVAVNLQAPDALKGWAVPAATDIAFTLGVLALLGARVPVSLKIFVTALAIIDDLGAVVVIALFYTDHLATGWLAAAAAALAALVALNRLKVRSLAPYLLLGAALWAFVLQSGVHATLAGVALALTIPITCSPGRPEDRTSPLHRLERRLHPLCAYAVLPLFGFANAGVALDGVDGEVLLAPVTLGVAAGLFLGKQIGVFLSTWIAVRLKLADCPEDASWPQVYGVSVLCGIGFTMSLFIGLLAFADSTVRQTEVKIGVLAGSIASALVGALVLSLARRERGAL